MPNCYVCNAPSQVTIRFQVTSDAETPSQHVLCAACAQDAVWHLMDPKRPIVTEVVMTLDREKAERGLLARGRPASGCHAGLLKEGGARRDG
jgi:hypothetical protein